MIITHSWLKEHLNSKANEAKTIEQLTSIGLEVEGIKENKGELNEFKIARSKHRWNSPKDEKKNDATPSRIWDLGSDWTSFLDFPIPLISRSASLVTSRHLFV